jgi:hypothetical protein
MLIHFEGNESNKSCCKAVLLCLLIRSHDDGHDHVQEDKEDNNEEAAVKQKGRNSDPQNEYRILQLETG